ncbi:hypothetical protein Salat_0563100 [Sesamum alatum]|uniref:Uncharacterized protein n=1 Tax=Sesamum alatum TaxID=300844 RepID=A0AAE1YPT9_9LAMI|nr:hypothetical protein Salat_0563100 [Sesamum alatum]
MEEAEHGQNETQSQTEISFQVSQFNVVSQTHTSFLETSKLTVGQQQQLVLKPPRKAPSSTPISSAPCETPSSSRHPSPAPRPGVAFAHVLFAPDHSQSLLKKSQEMNIPAPLGFKVIQKDGKKFFTINSLNVAVQNKRAQKLSKAQGKKKSLGTL